MSEYVQYGELEPGDIISVDDEWFEVAEATLVQPTWSNDYFQVKMRPLKIIFPDKTDEVLRADRD